MVDGGELLRNLGTVRDGSIKEAETRRILIDPILEHLGWNLKDRAETRMPFVAGNGQVDYGFLLGGQPALFVEAKKVGEPLDIHEGQLQLYVINEGVEVSALTDGIRWRVYALLRAGPLSRRKMEIDGRRVGFETLLNVLDKMLSRNAVQTGAWRSAFQARVAQATSLDHAQDRPPTRLNGTLDRRMTAGVPAGEPKVSSTRAGRPAGSQAEPRRRQNAAQTKMQIVFDALRAGWCKGSDLTKLTGQPGGWPKYCHNHYVRSGRYGEVTLLKKGIEYRLVPNDEVADWLKRGGVEVYPRTGPRDRTSSHVMDRT